MKKDYAETYKEYKSRKYKYTKGIGKLSCYQGLDYLKNHLKGKEELEDSFVFIESYINSVEQENEKLKDNWNKLKEYIKETKLKEFEKSYSKRYGKTFTQAEIIVCNMILDKMRELQGSDSDE